MFGTMKSIDYLIMSLFNSAKLTFVQVDFL